MSTMNCQTKNPLQRDGTSQQQRMLEALDPSYAKIHEFTLRDWMLFARHYAQQLNYYVITDDKNALGNWKDFMPADDEIDGFLQNIQKKDAEATVEPHLALFICFLKLLQEAQEQMNGITKRQLDFYYKKVLALKNKPAVKDKVHLIFELAKNMASYKLADSTLFDAGKDNGAPPKPLEYLIIEGPVIYPAKIESIKSVLHQQGLRVGYAEIANSLDGCGAPLDKDNPVWFAFGQSPDEKGRNVKLPAAKLGFALASPVLLLKEGKRVITITMDLVFPAGAVDYSVFGSLQQQLTILLTGEKDWIVASPSNIAVSKKPAAVNTQSNNITNTASQTQLEFSVTIDSAEKAIIGYSNKLHKENYSTDAPIMRVLLQTGEDTGYKAWKELAKARLSKCSINVSVEGMKDLTLENDEGKLDPVKPFLPFGPAPKKESDFYVGSPEIFEKQWKTVTLNIEWKNRPGNFQQHYKAYKTRFLNNNFTRNSYDLNKSNFDNTDDEVTSDGYSTVDASYIKNGHWSTPEEKKLFTEIPIVIGDTDNIALNPVKLSPVFTQLYSTGSSANKLYTQHYLQASTLKMPFNLAGFNPGFAIANFVPQDLTAATKDNFIRLRLNQDFFHANFSVLYAAAITIPGGIIPSVPYTPMIASLTVGYKAVASNEFAIRNNTPEQKLENYQQRTIQFFHESPFGQAEQHVFLKEQHDFIEDKSLITAVPVYKSEGECLIGVSNLATETILSILFQVAEGSENPESPAFDKRYPIEWYMLSNNEWKFLNDDFMLSDETNNFLRPGVIKFLIPKEANSGNTVLPKDQFWLKAQLPPGATFDSVCKFIAMLAQANEADFLDDENNLSHLATALPAGTISKMLNKQSAVKGITQPFNSFGGIPEEEDKHFYIRVSERLRHKNRAVDIWDYERLVLEKFPGIYKVKCLNHTSSDLELAPGFVRLIPVPDIRNKNIYDILEPRVSKNTLSEIQAYLDGLNSFFVDCRAENPIFEPVRFEFSVRFYQQYDPKGYTKILNEELKKFLSPWAYDSQAEIQFGGAIYKSRMIAFIEELPYVDYISGFRMYNTAVKSKSRDEITADSSRAILTSYKEHTISIIQPPICP